MCIYTFVMHDPRQQGPTGPGPMVNNHIKALMSHVCLKCRRSHGPMTLPAILRWILSPSWNHHGTMCNTFENRMK